MAAIVNEGDFVRDPMDNNRIRQVAVIVGDELFMEDGGVMGAAEVEDVILESEMIDHQQH
jgi:hypothetical protein